MKFLELSKIIKTAKERLLDLFDHIRNRLKEYFIASGTDSKTVRAKHVRVGVLLAIILIVVIAVSVLIGNSIDQDSSNLDPSKINKAKGENKRANKVEINKLATGASNEQLWMEGAAQELVELKQKQNEHGEEQNKLQQYVDKQSISKEELGDILKQFEGEIEKKYTDKLQEQFQHIAQAQTKHEQQNSPIEITATPLKPKLKRIGEYIPAGSYVEASMISGVDAGVGISAESDPRQVLLRITGKAISAGYGKDYLTTNALMGCLVQCQAVGDLSSEKVYLKPVVMTCAKNSGSVVEVPVKGYVSASGKSGIRGEVISREGDLVTQSFLSGLFGGIGSSVSQKSNPGISAAGGVLMQNESKMRNLITGGFGEGASQSANHLSEYLIKRAEQYQPVISIDEGTKVNLVFQEGVSLNEEDYKEEYKNEKQRSN